MKSYQELLKDVLDNGRWKTNRTGIKAKTVFSGRFRHNLNDGFPLLTTKDMSKSIRIIAAELEFFIKGLTDKQWLKDRKVRIWNEWANPVIIAKTEEDTGADRKELQEQILDLGPIYGFQWRNFNGQYGELITGLPADKWVAQSNYNSDQLQRIIDLLQNNPNDRTMLCSAWNPKQMHMQALPPCHFAWGIVHIDGTLNLWWDQRSADLFLGVPFNIASYSLLLLIICNLTGFKPGEVEGNFRDMHLYENQIDIAKEQTNRIPYKLPTIEFETPSKIDEFNHETVKLNNYEHYDKLTCDVAI